MSEGDAERLAHDLDLLSVRELLAVIGEQDARVAEAVAAAREPLARAVELAVGRMRAGGRMVYVGAGTSGRLALLDAAELPPTYGVDPDRVQVIMAGGERAFLGAVEGAEDDTEAARAEVRARVGAADVVVGVAASGATPFTVAALQEARARGAATVAIAGRPGPLTDAADVSAVLDTGPEVVMGSTRMKAGSAQKMALNALSTAVMVGLGRVYGDLMVEMPPTNRKLGRRAVRMVELAAGVDRETASRALTEAAGRVSVAVLVARQGISADEAGDRLARAGSLREALRS